MFFVFCFLFLAPSLVGSATRLSAGCQYVVRHLCTARKPAVRIRTALALHNRRRRCARPPCRCSSSRPPVASRRGACRAQLTRLRHRPIVIVDMYKALAKEWSALVCADARQTRGMCNATSCEAILRRSDGTLFASIGVIATAHLATICVASPWIDILHGKRHEWCHDDRSLCEFLGSLRKKHGDGHATVAPRESLVFFHDGGLIWLLHNISPVRLVPSEHHETTLRNLQMLAGPRAIVLDVHSVVTLRFTRAEGAVPDSPVTVVRQFGRHDGRLLLVQTCEMVRHGRWMCGWIVLVCSLYTPIIGVIYSIFFNSLTRHKKRWAFCLFSFWNFGSFLFFLC